jgi:hypothetical protein
MPNGHALQATLSLGLGRNHPRVPNGDLVHTKRTARIAAAAWQLLVENRPTSSA